MILFNVKLYYYLEIPPSIQIPHYDEFSLLKSLQDNSLVDLL